MPYKFLYSSFLFILASINKCDNHNNEVTSSENKVNVDNTLFVDSILTKSDINVKQDNKFHLENLIPITNDNKEYTNPIWSPDGKKILYTLVGYKGLYYYDFEDKKSNILLDTDGIGYGANWANDSKFVNYRIKKYSTNKTSYFEVYSIAIDSKKVQAQPAINPDGIKSYSQAVDSESLIIFTNTKTLKIEAETFNKSKRWIVTKDDGQFYNAILSPDSKKVLVHRGSDMLIYSLDGDGLISNIGSGIGCSWSKDGKQILFFLDESSDGNQITGSDLYIINIDGSNKQKITNTDNMFEMYPMFSPDNNKIVFSDGKSGKIYIADIIK